MFLFYCIVCYIIMPFLITHDGRSKGRTEYSKEEIREIAFAPLLISFVLVMVVVMNVSAVLKRRDWW